MAGNIELIAACGLYCGQCNRYLKKSCPGCKQNKKATWCKVRSCCNEKRISSWADCTEFKDLKDCKKFNNWISKIFGAIFNSDRAACILRIKEAGYTRFAAEMDANKRQTIKKR